jgi:hypothetical protein
MGGIQIGKVVLLALHGLSIELYGSSGDGLEIHRKEAHNHAANAQGFSFVLF